MFQIVVFLFLFFTYVFSVTGNLAIILLTLLDSHLKTPMYFFLHNFSFLEISFTTVCIPRFLMSAVTKDRTISYMSCMTVFVVFFFWESLNFTFYLLCLNDHYVAICKPLHYTTLMSNRVCHQLILSSWATGFLRIFPPVILGLKLEFCDSNVIDHCISDCFPIL